MPRASVRVPSGASTGVIEKQNGEGHPMRSAPRRAAAMAQIFGTQRMSLVLHCLQVGVRDLFISFLQPQSAGEESCNDADSLAVTFDQHRIY